MLEEKIRERTFELESNHNEFLSALNERTLTSLLTKLLIVETVNIIRGLCYTASIDAPDSAVSFYLYKIDNTSRRLAKIMEG